MKHYKNVEVPAKTESKLDKTTCDLCNSEIKLNGYQIDEVVIKHKTGESYPEGGQGEEINIDMCSECFTNKLTPWLKSEGAEIKIEDWDW